MTIGAAVDVGSNSIHLLVAEVGAGGDLRLLADESVQLGLGDVVDREGSLPAESRDAIVGALQSYAAKARDLGAGVPIQMGTEPLRRASNRSVIQSDVLRATGAPLHVLSHEAEGQLTLLGVTGGHAATEGILVVDVGGGSSEVILAGPGTSTVVGALPTGSARLTATFVAHDPPTWFEINALRAEAARLAGSLPDTRAADRPRTGVGVGGSATNLARLAAGGPIAPAFPRSAIADMLALLAARTVRELATEFGVSARRAQQLPAGAALIEAVMAHYALDELRVSTASLREGAVLAAQHGPDWLERLPSLISAGPAR